jgi:hypothetical protein
MESTQHLSSRRWESSLWRWKIGNVSCCTKYLRYELPSSIFSTISTIHRQTLPPMAMSLLPFVAASWVTSLFGNNPRLDTLLSLLFPPAITIISTSTQRHDRSRTPKCAAIPQLENKGPSHRSICLFVCQSLHHNTCLSRRASLIDQTIY